MRFNLKEARLQRLVLKYMNRIGGLVKRMRYHSLPTSKPYERGVLPGRSGSDWPKEQALTRGDLNSHGLAKEKSADAIVVTRYEPVEITGSLTQVAKGRTNIARESE